MTRGEKLIKNISIFLLDNPDFENKDKILEIIQPFISKFDSEDLDFETIAKLESLIGFELVIIPTKQEWRKIKLEHLNNIENEE